MKKASRKTGKVSRTIASKVSKKKVAKRKVLCGGYKAKTTKKKKVSKLPNGYGVSSGNIIARKEDIESKAIVPPSKFRLGFKKAKKEIDEIINDIVLSMRTNDVISEVELSIGFNVKGEFIGFGVGGAASLKIKIDIE